MADLLVNACAAGLLWFPIVLALGLMYRHLKIIDVSIDGVAIIAGIASGWAWNASGSYVLSFTAAIVAGVAGNVTTAALIHALRIEPLLAGVLATLALHSVSVVLVGESLVVPGSKFAQAGATLWVWLTIVFVSLSSLAVLFYRTNLGVLARALGSNPKISSPLSPGVVLTTATAFSGLLLGVGVTTYVHAEGVARAGSGFEFLLTGLTSYLVPERFLRSARRRIQRWSVHRSATERASRTVSMLVASLQSVWFVALTGSLTFQLLVYLVITYSPRPDIWKLIVAACLIAGLATPDRKEWFGRRLRSWRKVPRASSTGVPTLTVTGLSKMYTVGGDPRHVLRNVDFRCSPGLAALTGPNGVGKTSLLRCLSGDLEPDAGQVLLGADTLEDARLRRSAIFHLKQDPHANLAADLSLLDNLTWVRAAFHPLFEISSTSQLLRDLERLAGDLSATPAKLLSTPAQELSGGEAQCAAIAMAALSGRRVVLADEPTANLDRANRERVLQLLHVISRSSIIIAVTHDVALTSRADTTFLLDANGITQTSATPAVARG